MPSVIKHIMNRIRRGFREAIKKREFYQGGNADDDATGFTQKFQGSFPPGSAQILLLTAILMVLNKRRRL